MPSWVGASDALRRLRDGSLSVEDHARQCLARIDARDADVGAWVFVDREAVLASARALDASPSRGPLHGLPVGIKDVILTHDAPTQYNSTLHQGFHPRIDAACVRILRAAGALIFGKTETVEFAADARPARTRNPHDLRHTPGGSSSGSAAAVADGHVPLALATQTGGSTIRPASYCGIHAIKPTWNLVSPEGAKAFSATLDTIGWFGRSVDDLLLVYDVFETEPATQPMRVVSECRIGLCRTPMWELAEPATRRALETAAERLRAAGATVVDLELPSPMERLPAAQTTIMNCEARSAFLPDYRAHFEEFGGSARDRAKAPRGATHRQLLDAYDLAAQCRPLFDRLAADFDAVLTPSTVGTAPLLADGTGPSTFNGIWSLLHTPCVNVPGFTGADGMPVGLTLTGPRFSDRRVLAVAAAVAPLFARA